MMEEKNYKYQVLVNGSGRVIDVSNPDSSGARGWSYDSATKIITIFDPNDYTLTGNTNENKVVIEPTSPTNLPFNIILQQVDIDKSSEANGSAICMKGNIFCRLLVYGYNYFYSGSDAAGINVSYGSSVEIDELIPDRSGYIRILGGNSAACIGANSGESYGNITIKDVELEIGIGNGGAGIGFGDYSSEGDSGEIKILGGFISMYSYNGYIMGGIYCKKVEISSGKLVMDFYDHADGIFLKDDSNLEGEITISGDAEVIIHPGNYSTAINCAGGKLIVNGGVVKAYSRIDGCGIGSMYWNHFKVIINGGVVCAYGGEKGAGIGTNSGWGFGGGYINYSSIEINGGIVSAYGKEGGAGIGGGVGVKMPNIKISSEASVMAQAYGDGAYDIGDGVNYGNQGDYFSGIFSSVCMYRGQMSGTYQGRLSGLFKGEVQRDYTKRVSCNLSGFYTGKATGRYSGIFLGRYVGYLEYSSLYTGLYSGLYSGLYEDIYSKKKSR